MIIQIENLEDERIAIYRDLKRNNIARRQNLFIAEGKLVVHRLLASSLKMHSLLVSDSRLDSIQEILRPDVPIYIIPAKLATELVGFNFHVGLLAAGVQPVCASIDIEALPPHSLLVACPKIVMPENLGSIIRLAASFQVDGLLVGSDSVEPYSRRVVRVSMGNIFTMPIAEPRDMASELNRLKREGGFEIVAANRSATAVPLQAFVRSPRTVLLLGNEAEGISEELMAICDRQVMIEMSSEVDSLNVSTAAGILLYQLQHAGM